jgi:hypothetical protein
MQPILAARAVLPKSARRGRLLDWTEIQRA